MGSLVVVGPNCDGQINGVPMNADEVQERLNGAPTAPV
jgi:hypothetical protein